MAAKKTGKTPASRPRPRRVDSHDEADEGIVTFDLSDPTSKVIDRALKGLTAKQKDRVMEALDAVGNEIGAKVGRWVEKRFVHNSNELLLVLTPILVKGGLWGELRGIWAFLDELGVRIDHKKIGKALDTQLGAHMAGHYREVVASTKETAEKPPEAQPAS
jgi:hypothetical protein